MRKAREVYERVGGNASPNHSYGQDRGSRNNQNNFSNFEDFKISKPREEIGDSDEDAVAHRRGNQDERLPNRHKETSPPRNGRDASVHESDSNQLLDEGLEMLDSVGLSTGKPDLNPSLAARLGPEVMSMRARVHSLVNSSKDDRREHGKPQQKSYKNSNVGNKESSVFEVIDSDSQENYDSMPNTSDAVPLISKKQIK